MWRSIVLRHTADELFHGDPGEPSAKNQGVGPAGEVHAEEENEVRKTVYQRTSHNDYPGILEMKGEDTQSGHRGPTEDEAEDDGADTCQDQR